MERALFWVHSLAHLLKESLRTLSNLPFILGRGLLTLGMLFGLLIVGEPLGFWIIHPKTTAWVLADPARADMERLLKRLNALHQEGFHGAKPVKTSLKRYPNAMAWRIPFAQSLDLKERKSLEEGLNIGLGGLRVLWQDPKPLLGFENPQAARRFVVLTFMGLASLGFVYAFFLYQAIERDLGLWSLWFWHGLPLKDFKILGCLFVVLQGLFDTLLWGSVATLTILGFHLGPSRDFLVIAWAWMGILTGLSGFFWVQRLLRSLLEHPSAT